MNKPSWSAGYVSDAPYTLGFYPEMGVEHLAFAAAINGYVLPARPGLRYCELGCGRGYGTLLMAAANPDRSYVGIDFNPAHIQEAKALAERAGIDNVRFVEASFAEMAESGDPELSEFDIVALHGVFTWIGEEVVADVQQFLRRHLKPGGYCYASYNTLPGWTQILPVQKLIREVAVRTPGDSLRGFAAANRLLKAMDTANVGFLKQNPGARARIARFDKHAPQYLVHEYLNEHWKPLYVTEMMAIMSEAKLGYVGLASVIQNRQAFNVPESLMGIYNEAPDFPMRELLKDFIANRQFRRDIYVKGGVRAGKQELERAYENMMLVQFGPFDEEKTEWAIPIGTARPDPKALKLVLEALADGPARIGEIRRHGEKQGLNWNDLPGILEILMDAGVVRVCRADHATVDRAPSERLNRAVLELALGEDTHRYLASPVLGSAITTSYVDRLLAPLILKEGEGAPVDLAAVHDFLQRHGKRITDQGEALTDEEAARTKLGLMIEDVRARTLPHWRKLGIAG